MAHRMPYNLRPSESTSNLHEAVADCGTPAGCQVIFLPSTEKGDPENNRLMPDTPVLAARSDLVSNRAWPGEKPPTRVCGATMPNAVVNLAARNILIRAFLTQCKVTHRTRIHL